MSRLPYKNISDLHSSVREVYDALPLKLGIFRMFAHAERNFSSLVRLGGTILGRQMLDDKLRELAILQVARVSKAEYEWVQHVPIAERAGATKAQIAALEKGEIQASCFDELERDVLGFTSELIDHARPSDAVLEPLKQKLSAQEIVELVVAIGFYMLVARIMETTGLDLEPAGGVQVVEAIDDVLDE
ncbi:MAG: carboxymuconolactone decarboxylase family protein [bacterium]|nr:carboxymuconolactone decarboxylase family protein [bacterium]